MKPRIFLIGFMGSGKTTLGSRLARKMGYEFVDMDQLIEETSGMTVPVIFTELGEEVFRKWEHDILLELCQREKLVVATGGGAPCHGEMMSTMNQNGETVYIKLTPEALKDRLTHSKTNRPLIRGKSEQELLHFITTLLETRELFYNRATYIVDGIKLDPEQLAKLLKQS
ncbi:MAG: shikimate kinase [Bacteroidales bacterium]